VAATTFCMSGNPGTAKNMPMTAQKTASCVTRGLVSTKYWRQSESEGAVAAVMVVF
jgi:hypothetical protein